jgi:hypothetical protein
LTKRTDPSMQTAAGAEWPKSTPSSTLPFTEATARAYPLLHVFLHELGHHHDRMTTRPPKHSARGERFADDYAMPYPDRVWQRYLDTFGLP